MANQKPTDILFPKHDSKTGDQGSVSSAPGHGVEESKEEAPEVDLAVSIKSSKSTTSSRYGSHAN